MQKVLRKNWRNNRIVCFEIEIHIFEKWEFFKRKYIEFVATAVDKCVGFCYYKQANRKKIDELLNLFGNERCHSCVSTFYQNVLKQVNVYT